MPKKQLLIELIESDLTLPKHLQKPPSMNIDIKGMNTLELMTVVSSLLPQLIQQLTTELNNQQNTNPLKIIN